MSKYEKLWEFVSNNRKNNLKLTFDEIEKISGVKIDHSFLTYKKELLEYGFCVTKISMKEQTVLFKKR